MKRQTRRILFYTSIVLFMFFGYIAILYAQGYKYSFKDNRFVRTGAISLKVNTGASIYFNDKLVGDTSFITDAFSKGSLLPGRYTIKVSREGYTTWQKKAVVEEGYLTDFPKIMILSESEEEVGKIIQEASATPTITPKPSKTPIPPPAGGSTPKITEPYYLKNKILYKNNDVEPEIVAKNVLGFVLSKNEGIIGWWNNNNEVWVMWLKNTDYQPYHQTGDQELVTRFSTKIKNVSWFKDEDHVLVDSLGYKIVEIDTRGGVNIIKL